ncbi:uncharacterized protein LOC141908930 [Tubulanus polymorphus]|uniref:uncharacterized protein LOC141908930 n=1 Tax=Tubulanus polymorphus TaxID=672921 RepID=UPI003DA29C64
MADHDYYHTSKKPKKAKKCIGRRNCCVPYCTKSGYYEIEGHGTVSYFKFPSDPVLRRSWLSNVRREEGEFFKITEHTRVCSQHFVDADYRDVSNYSGRRYLKPDAVPSVFQCFEGKDFASTRKTGQTSLKNGGPKVGSAIASETRGRTVQNERPENEVSVEPFSENDVVSPILNGAADGSYEGKLEQSTSTDVRNRRELLRKVTELERENRDLKYRLKNCRCESSFCADGLSEDSDVYLYTGFPDKKVFESVLSFLNPGSSGENLMAGCSGASTDGGKHGGLSPRDQFLAFLCRVHLGLSELDLAGRFGVSVSSVTSIVVTWANFISFRLGGLSIWPTKQQVVDSMPRAFRENLPNARVIINCKEIACELPPSLIQKSKSYSNSDDNSNALKGLVGLTPSGNVCFVSQLYIGGISDREITERCGILQRQHFDRGDDVVARDSFDIQSLLDPLSLRHITISSDDQIIPVDLASGATTRSVASRRICVERLVSKMERFRIFDQVIPIALLGSVNEIWTSCALLTLFQSPIDPKRDSINRSDTEVEVGPPRGSTAATI